MNDTAVLLGRIGLSLIFIISGWGKLQDLAGTQQYMAAMGVPGLLAPLVIVAELGGGLAILAGLFTRLVAVLLAVFCLLTAAIFHLDFGDQAQAVNFMKNLAMAGGFLVLAAQGAGLYSVDAQWRKFRRA
jgi:putative oxidoreductase